jgi:hypothetical protein
MHPIFLHRAMVIAHLSLDDDAITDGPTEQLALTADGSVWHRILPSGMAGPDTQPGPEEGWTLRERVAKAKMGDWLVLRLSEGWDRLGSGDWRRWV